MTYTGTPSYTATEFTQQYYDEHKAAGLDYLSYSGWQQAYGRMVTHATLQITYRDSMIADIGCACGSILYGFKKTGMYSRVFGIDLNAHMVGLGRERFEFSEDELVCGSAEKLPLSAHSVTLVHSAQVLEHIPAERMPAILSEMYRVLRPGGRAFLNCDAIKYGQLAEMYHGDPTHCNLRPMIDWMQLFTAHGFTFDVEAYDRFARFPDGGFYKTYTNWSTWTLIKL